MDVQVWWRFIGELGRMYSMFSSPEGGSTMNWIKKISIKYSEMHEVRKDGILVFRGPESECWHWVHTHTSNSVDWAMKNEGYTITPAGSDWRDAYNWAAPENTQNELDEENI